VSFDGLLDAPDELCGMVPWVPVLDDELPVLPVAKPDELAPLVELPDPLENARNSVAEMRPSLSRSRLLNWLDRPCEPGRIPVLDEDDGVDVPDVAPNPELPDVPPDVELRPLELEEPVAPVPAPVEDRYVLPGAAPERSSVDVPELGLEDELEPVPEVDPDPELEPLPKPEPEPEL